MTVSPQNPDNEGGLARYFVAHPQVGWLLLAAVLLWGWFAYHQLAQQEDPKIPDRQAMLVTHFPGANAAKIEELVTRKLEKKISELERIDELSSQSRAGVSIIDVSLRFTGEAKVEQEWDKLRAKLSEVALPEGCQAPWLNTDFGKTVTLLFALTSPPVTEAECRIRAELIKTRLQELRAATGHAGRAAVVAFFPPAFSPPAREHVSRRFLEYLEKRQIAVGARLINGHSFLMAEFASNSARELIEGELAEFVRETVGTDVELMPDFAMPLVLMGDEDPLPMVRNRVLPRYTYRQLEMAADDLEDELKQLPSVGRVTKVGIVPETVYLEYSMPKVVGYGLSSSSVTKAISSRNAVIPGGVMRTEGQAFPVLLTGEFSSEEELLGVVVGVSRSGQPVYLRDLFDVFRTYQDPIQHKVSILHRSQPSSPLTEVRSVLVAVEMKEGQIIREFNGAVTRRLVEFRPRLPDGMQVLTISDQPESVARRIGHFMTCFFEAVIIVVMVALFLMDWRSALVVATAIPLTLALTVAGMHLFGVALHQISIAALVIALGMLVDDPVVASDAINRELARNQPRSVAGWLGPWKLRHAIFYATVINVVAFAPLALLPGDTGAFIVALPIVVTLSLAASRLVSMTFIPLLGCTLLRGQKGLEAGGEVRSFFLFRPVDRALAWALPRYKNLLLSALAHPWRTLGIAYGLLAASLPLALLLGEQFFPPAERDQLLVDVELPETASIMQTRAACAEVVELLRHHEEVRTAAVFTGGTAPRFYYNVLPKVPGDYLAQVLINTRRAQDVSKLLVELREELDRKIAAARITVRQLEQGPPLEVPIQIRLSGEDLDVLRRLADRLTAALREAGGYKVHDDLGRRMPALQVDIDQERANTIGIDNTAVGRVVQSAFADVPVTQLREGDHLVPVVIRLRAEERSETDKIRGFYAESTVRGQPVPLESFAELKLKPQFAVIAHYGQMRTVTVKSFAPFGELPSAVLARARPALDALSLPPGYRLEYAGEERELLRHQREMGGVMALSLALIFLAIVFQFNSAVKSLVVILTVPLGIIGALVGLAVTRSPLGFMAMLGIVSLAGVIVSHIIVLSDYIEAARKEGMEVKEALVQAGLVRLRAVLVTVLATMGGLIPLAVTGGELWRPLTAVHIFGLLFATLLTLVLLPVLYFIFSAKLRFIK